ncbi:hypothetical protein JXR93_01965 [bacterium]|nr:hypothetical protein [bacterium]
MKQDLLTYFFNCVSRQAMFFPAYQPIVGKLVQNGILWDCFRISYPYKTDKGANPKNFKRISWNPYHKMIFVDSKPIFLQKVDYLSGLGCLVGYYPEFFPQSF